MIADASAQTGIEPGGPSKGARVIITIVNADHPPLQISLWRDAVRLTRQHDQAMVAETDR